jgi:hypothetical protein
MQIVRTPGQGFPLKPFFPDVRYAIVIGIGQFPYTRRRSDIKGSLIPHGSLWKHHPIGKYQAGIENPIPIPIFKPHDSMWFFLELCADVRIGPRGIRDIKPTLLIKIRDNGTIHQRGIGYLFNRKAVRQSKPVNTNLLRSTEGLQDEGCGY